MSKSLKSTTFTGEPVFIEQDGTQRPYIAHDIKTARHAFGASLDILFKHSADVFLLTVTILAEKTRLPVEEILETVTNDPRYKGMMVDPQVNTLSYFTEEEGNQHVSVAKKAAADDEDLYDDDDVEQVTKAVAEMTVAAPVATKRKKILKKAAPKTAV